MNPINHKDDPRLTAYALGELPQGDREQVEALLRDDESARQIVEEIRATAAALATSLASERTDAALTSEQREQIAAASRPPQPAWICVTRRLGPFVAAAAVIALCYGIFV